MRSENDYRINLKAELEIENLHVKFDQFTVQWQNLIEIQRVQIDLLRQFQPSGAAKYSYDGTAHDPADAESLIPTVGQENAGSLELPV